MIANDVNRARAAMNLSDWTDRPGQAKGLLAAGCAGVESQRMPPANYRMLHPEAALTPQQVAQFCAWTAAQTGVLRRPPHAED
jgi:hypothetical protein